jgi:hypothetical protein
MGQWAHVQLVRLSQRASTTSASGVEEFGDLVEGEPEPLRRLDHGEQRDVQASGTTNDITGSLNRRSGAAPARPLDGKPVPGYRMQAGSIAILGSAFHLPRPQGDQ